MANQAERKFASNSVMTYDDIVNGKMQWTFRTAGTIAFAVRAMTDDRPLTDVEYAAMVHGFKQKIADTAAIPADKKTGKSASEAEKFEAMLAEAVRLAKPGATWNSTERAARVDPWFEDLVAVVAETVRKLPDGTTAELGIERAREYLKSKSQPEREALSRLERYAARFDAIRAARVAALADEAKRMENEIDGL